MIETTVLNVVHFQNHGTHNFLHLKWKNVQHGTLEKKSH